MTLGARMLQRGARADANIVAMLSLKLLLLAFFILLSTMSQFEERRSRAVMDSVATTFRGQVTAVVNADAPEAGLGLKERQANLRRGIAALFRQTLPVVEVETSADGRLLRLEMAANTFFGDGQAALRERQDALLDRLVRALTTGEAAPDHFELEILHAVPSQASAESARLSVDRAGALVRNLAGRGLARRHLAAGLWPTAGDTDRLAFEIHLPRRAASDNPLTGTPAGGQVRR